MDDFLVRLATKEDTEEVLSLMKACFGERVSLTREWYKWFNYDCPTGLNRNYIAIDVSAKRIVGGYGLLPIRVKVNNEVQNGSLCTNVMTHPDYQGRGLFIRLGRHGLSCEERFQNRVSLGIPNNNAIPGHMRVGWKRVSDLRFIAKHSFQDKSHLSKEVPSYDARVDRLIHQVAEQVNFMVFKDHRFLNWRYKQRPHQKYRLFIFENNGSVNGYMILKYFEEDGYKKTHILDIMANCEDVFMDLISTAEQHSHGSDELNCWLVDNSIYDSLFTDSGFIPSGNKSVLMAHTNYGQEIIPRRNNWLFALGDNDVY